MEVRRLVGRDKGIGKIQKRFINELLAKLEVGDKKSRGKMDVKCRLRTLQIASQERALADTEIKSESFGKNWRWK
jgi:hypothetical protein